MSGFPNLACHKPFSEDDIERVTQTCKEELEAAGASPFISGIVFDHPEIPSKCIGEFGPWVFRRRWYYWSAEGPGVPPDVAELLHAQHGKVVRVAGHCGCPSPREWYKGFGVGLYHVDTPEGLKALIDTLRTIYDPSKNK